MELTWTTEKSEKETVKLFLRRRGFLNVLRVGVAVLAVFWTVACSFCAIALVDDIGSIIGITVAGVLVLCLCFWAFDKWLTNGPRHAYRQRKTHKVEYRLTDDVLAFTIGETSFSSPWNNVAKKFKLYSDALILFGKDLPFEAQCIPDWRGHGVGRNELVAALSKAGLKKIWKKRFKMLIGLAVASMVLATLLTIYFYIGGIEWGDWTIPNESALRLELRDVPDEENAYLALQALTNLYHVAEGDWNSGEVSDKKFVSLYKNPFFSAGDDESLEAWAAIRSDTSSPGRAARILADNAKFFEDFRKSLSLKGYAEADKRREDAKRKSEGKNPWISYLPLYKPFIDFAQLVAFRSQVAIEKGDIESAVSDIGEIHSWGQLVMANGESLVTYLVGALIEKISFRKMCDIVALGSATDEIIERFSKMVAVSEANAPSVWERALKTEIAMHSEGVEWVCTHSDFVLSWMLNANIFDSLDPSPSRAGRMLSSWPGFAKFAFHRHEMLYRQAMLGRAMLAGDDDLTEMILHEIPRSLFLPNCVGNNIISGLCPILSPFSKEGSLNRLRPRLVLASEKWRRAHGGENPPSLEALVPDYLAAVPRDPWSKSGEPVKYDALLGVAWSVGKDGKYDYREIAKDIPATGNKASINGDTQKYAFRLDGKPIGFGDGNVIKEGSKQ